MFSVRSFFEEMLAVRMFSVGLGVLSVQVFFVKMFSVGV